ncbi:MAG: hypothetical protein JNM31_09875 [Flavobacteriales bacterium]|nr:hypothetical protein [Flavobacteriales bacterium]
MARARRKDKSPPHAPERVVNVAAPYAWPVWLGWRQQLLLLVAIALGFYVNTLGNQYALDDGLVISEHPLVKEGFAGIPGILSTDTYAHFYERHGMTERLTGGRYRPLSLVTFAIEWSLFARADEGGTVRGNPAVSHAVNALLYALTIALLVCLFHRHWFPTRPALAFIAAFLFTIHPVHTEAVANIKGRDEILSMLFLVGTLILVHRHVERGGWRALAGAAACYFLALLSKENGITFLAVIPLALYVFNGLSLKRIAAITVPFFGVAFFFLILRAQVVGFGGGRVTDFMNDPFLLAGPGQRLPTVFTTLLAYIKLLVLPHPLAYDYGYAAFPMVKWSDAGALVSLAVHLGLVVAAVRGILHRQVWAFGIAFYLITLSIVSNVFFSIGTSLGERFVYLSSLGFVMAVAVPLEGLVARGNKAVNSALALVAVVLLLVAGRLTTQRNAEWRDNDMLFLADVAKVPQSVKANVSAAARLIDMALDSTRAAEKPELLARAMGYLDHALELQRKIPIEKHFPDTYLNRGLSQQLLGNTEAAARNYLVVKPGHYWVEQNAQTVKNALLAAASPAYDRGDAAFAVSCLQRVWDMEPGSVEIASNLGHANYKKGDLEATKLWYTRWAELAPNDVAAWLNLGGFSYTHRDKPTAINAFQHVLQLAPGHPEAQAGLAAAQAL